MLAATAAGSAQPQQRLEPVAASPNPSMTPLEQAHGNGNFAGSPGAHTPCFDT